MTLPNTCVVSDSERSEDVCSMVAELLPDVLCDSEASELITDTANRDSDVEYGMIVPKDVCSTVDVAIESESRAEDSEAVEATRD